MLSRASIVVVCRVLLVFVVLLIHTKAADTLVADLWETLRHNELFRHDSFEPFLATARYVRMLYPVTVFIFSLSIHTNSFGLWINVWHGVDALDLDWVRGCRIIPKANSKPHAKVPVFSTMYFYKVRVVTIIVIVCV